MGIDGIDIPVPMEPSWESDPSVLAFASKSCAVKPFSSQQRRKSSGLYLWACGFSCWVALSLVFFPDKWIPGYPKFNEWFYLKMAPKGIGDEPNLETITFSFQPLNLGSLSLTFRKNPKAPSCEAKYFTTFPRSFGKLYENVTVATEKC